MKSDNHSRISLKTGFIAALSVSIITLIVFVFAMMAVPPAGPYCPGDCMYYPFEDLLDYFPRDYYWMYFAIVQLIAYVIFIISIHVNASAEKRITSTNAVAFALIAAIVLLIDYYIQFAVIPVSVMKGEDEGIALLTQYNAHGIFIALEELGFLMMSISFLFLSFVFRKKDRLSGSIRWILVVSFVLTLLSFIYYLVIYGIEREYRFEVAAITINWLALIVVGILIGVYFNRRLKHE